VCFQRVESGTLLPVGIPLWEAADEVQANSGKRKNDAKKADARIVLRRISFGEKSPNKKST
jgi:hypothetical protein